MLRLPIPLGNRILIKRVKDKKPQGGLILPDAHNSKEEYEVINIPIMAKSKEDISAITFISIGDIVLIEKYMASQIQVESEDQYLLVKVDDISAIYPKE